MDRNRIYFHNLNNTEKVLLAKSQNRSTFIIDFGKGGTTISLNKDGYYYQGNELPSSIKIYYDSSNNAYYITKDGNSTPYYITIEVLETNANGYVISGYGDKIDTSSFIQLNRINVINKKFNPLKDEYSDVSVEAGVVTQYMTYLPRTQYKSQSSLVLISVRDANGVGGSALLLLSRINTNIINPFTINYIYSDPNISQFNLIGNEDGFIFSNSNKYKYSITELSTPN